MQNLDKLEYTMLAQAKVKYPDLEVAKWAGWVTGQDWCRNEPG